MRRRSRWATTMRRIRASRPWVAAHRVRMALRQPLGFDPRVITLPPTGREARGRVLISYIKDIGNLIADERDISTGHTHHRELRYMAEAFLGLGYSVDAIDYRNLTFVPERDYSFFVDARRNMERLAQSLGGGCVKIMHLDTAHILYQNAAEAVRLLELQRRRGVVLTPRRWERPNHGIENADCATLLGNRFTFDTWSHAGKPIYRLHVPSVAQFPSPEAKDFRTCRRRFLWIGSYGLVHKGLDRVLEAFAAMPDMELFVCGPVAAERDFDLAFRKELYQTPNIHTIGWVDVTSPRFSTLVRSCVALVYPTCSEGQAGAVVTAMHAGLIPVIGFAAGVDVPADRGLCLRHCSVEEIQEAVTDLAQMPPERLRSMAVSTWEYARAMHTPDRYRADYTAIIERLAAARGSAWPAGSFEARETGNGRAVHDRDSGEPVSFSPHYVAGALRKGNPAPTGAAS